MLWLYPSMARDNHIIRPHRSARVPEPSNKALTRQERVALLVQSILPDVRAKLDLRQLSPPSKRKS